MAIGGECESKRVSDYGYSYYIIMTLNNT